MNIVFSCAQEEKKSLNNIAYTPQPPSKKKYSLASGLETDSFTSQGRMEKV